MIFDRTLTTAVGAPANWSGVGTFPGFTLLNPQPPITIAGNEVTFTCLPGFITPGPLRISYAAAPPNVVSSFGVPAAPFVDYPMLGIP